MQVKSPSLIKALMEDQNISGRQLSEAAGWKSHTYLQKILRGEIRTIEPLKADKIAIRLGVPREVLFLTRTSTNPEQDERSQRTKKAS